MKTADLQRASSCLPSLKGMIERRLLVNFRCDPDDLARLLPPPFRPKLVGGFGFGGICLIRLGGIHPGCLPAWGGLVSENAAHRIAVEWDEDGDRCEGVFIPRRDTNSWLNRLVGGRVFPGIHHGAWFEVRETEERFDIRMQSDDGEVWVQVLARLTDDLPKESVFRSMAEASNFFQGGAVGWSPRKNAAGFDGLELDCDRWHMEPLAVERVQSSFFENRKNFPTQPARFDSAFLMRNIEHTWLANGRLKASQKGGV